MNQTPRQHTGPGSPIEDVDIPARAIAVFGDADSAREWLETTLPALGGHSPLELCDTFAGRALVQDALKKIEYGEFA